MADIGRPLRVPSSKTGHPEKLSIRYSIIVGYG